MFTHTGHILGNWLWRKRAERFLFIISKSNACLFIRLCKLKEILGNFNKFFSLFLEIN